MYDDRFETDDPYSGHTPWLRRPVIRFLVTFVAVGSFLLATLLSSCGPRRTIPGPTTTTTIPTVRVGNLDPPHEPLIADV